MRKKGHIVFLSVLACAAVAVAQQQPEHWKEYIFAEGGFAITLPEAPKPHTDASIPDMTVYSAPKAMLTLRVSHQNRDCSNTLGQLRNGASQGKSGIDSTSVRELSIEGYPGLEYEWRREGGFTAADRFYCVNGKFYSFSTSWHTGQSELEAARKAIDSFRLLPANVKK